MKTKLKSVPLINWWSTPAVIITTYADVTTRYLKSNFYRTQLENYGLIPKTEKPMKDSTIGVFFRASLMQLIMNPQPYLCGVVNKHIHILKRKRVVGIQMRLGGKKANYKEKLFLGPSSIRYFVSAVRQYLKENQLRNEDVYLFVSTDSSYALDIVKKEFNMRNYTMVYSVDDWPIGHSALGKTLSFGEKQRDNFMNRAILDLLLLKESDFLIYSQGSSYGLLAYELQQSYKNIVNASAFMKGQGLTCSVFHERSSVGVATYVSKYRGRKNSRKV